LDSQHSRNFGNNNQIHQKKYDLQQLSDEYNFEGYTPLLLAVKNFLSRGGKTNTVNKFVDYWKNKIAVLDYEKECKKIMDNYENEKKK